MRINKLLLLGCLPFIITACSEEEFEKSGTGEKVKIELDVQQRSIQKKSNDFANQLMTHAAKENKNILISPLSLQVTLGMLANGANEQAYNEIITALDLKDYSLEELNEFHKIVMNGILNEQDPKVELSLSNSMWIDKSLQAKEVFKNNLKTYYNTSLYNVDFNKTDMANNEINNWANKETKGMIKDLQLPLTASTKFVLSNACYFDGQWSSPFNIKNTYTEFFTAENGAVQKVPMMHKTTKRIYLENDNYQLVSLDFGNKSFCMVIVLPQPSKTITEILPSIDWNTSNVSHEVDVILSLPKIKLETLTELNEILQGMGMESLYENNSLSNISNDLSLSWAQQNTCFEIDESGVKASSVTSANGMESSSGSIYEMVVNRPFLFAIRENSTNTLMFMGKIAKIE